MAFETFSSTNEVFRLFAPVGIRPDSLCQGAKHGKLLGFEIPRFHRTPAGRDAASQLERWRFAAWRVQNLRKERTPVSVVNSMNYAELLRGSGGLTPELIEQLQVAVAGPQISDVRQALTEVSRGVDESAGEDLLARLGVASYVLARHDDADSFLRGISTDGLAICYHAHSLSSMERHSDAAQRYEDAGKAGYDPIDATLRQAGCLRAQGQIDDAEQMLRSVAASAASRAEYSFQMGCIWADRGDALTAVEYFERAVDMDGHHARALFWLAAENSLRGNDEESIKLYERSLSKPPYFVGALLNLGLLYEDHERYQTAAFCFQRVIDFDPGNERALLYLKDIEATHNMHVNEEQARQEARMKQLLGRPVTDFEL